VPFQPRLKPVAGRLHRAQMPKPLLAA
jgi:hypothetical protein